jgi:MFS family permease
VTQPAPTSADRARLSLFSPAHRLTSLGILILMTIIAFEAMAVATALPTAARSLHDLGAFGWAFTGFLVASIVGMVVSGIYSDLRGPRVPLITGLALFAAGLVLGAAAPSMFVLISARFVQGFATGLLITAMYVVIGEVYDDRLRPRIFAAMSTAWVVPGLVGPIVAGWLTQQASWRWVFGGLSPFVVLGGLMVLPSLRQMRKHVQHDASADPRRIGYAVLAAGGIAGVASISEGLRATSIALAVCGAVAMFFGLRHLLPAGTTTFRPGVPAAVAYRGVLAGAFFGMESIVPLTLSVQYHFSPTAAGIPLMVSAITWAAGSQIQSRLDPRTRPAIVAAGLVLIAVAGTGMALVATHEVPSWAALFAWSLSGVGAGLALTSASVALLDFTNDRDRGSDSASLQIADSSAGALAAAFAGGLVAAASHGRLSYGVGLAIAFGVLAAIACCATGRVGALRPRAKPHRREDLDTVAAVSWSR